MEALGGAMMEEGKGVRIIFFPSRTNRDFNLKFRGGPA